MFLAAGLWLSLIMGCERVLEQNLSQPAKPMNVPVSAFWIGGDDGGVFVILEKVKASPKEVYFSEIYNDQTGEILYKGQLVLYPPGQLQIEYKNPHLFSGWDGEALHLKDGRLLKVVRKNSDKLRK